MSKQIRKLEDELFIGEYTYKQTYSIVKNTIKARIRGSYAVYAEDIIQDAMLHLCLDDKFDPNRGPAKNWIFIIARNAIARFHYNRKLLKNRNMMLPPKTSEYLSEMILDDAASQETKLMAIDGLTHLLKDLGLRDRKIVMRYLMGDNGQEIGEDMGLTRERVRQIIQKAVRKLQQKADI